MIHHNFKDLLKNFILNIQDVQVIWHIRRYWKMVMALICLPGQSLFIHIHNLHRTPILLPAYAGNSYTFTKAYWELAPVTEINSKHDEKKLRKCVSLFMWSKFIVFEKKYW